MIPALPPITISRHSLVECPGTFSDAAFSAMAKERASGSVAWVFLRSGGDAAQAGYSVAGWDPLFIFEGKSGTDGKAGVVALSVPGNGAAVWHGVSLLDTFSVLAEGIDHTVPFLTAPFSGGFLGYLAYDIKNAIERLPQRASDDLELPDIFQMFPRRILIHNRMNGRVVELRLDGSVTWEHRPDQDLPAWSALGRERSTTESPPAFKAPTTSEAPLSIEAQYISAVQRIREYIRNGDVYQVNLAQRFAFNAPADVYGFWEELYVRNPSPYFSYIHTPSHSVLSTSMERCVLLQGGKLRSQPIKGTRPRSADAAKDAALIRELRSDPKEHGELSMIVDLVRNDMSRVCEPGTVHVIEHARLDSYANVHHLSSVIEGKLHEGTSLSSILRALLPAGSVTGCPKIRAMEIIDELEAVARHLYTGSIGYIGLHGTMDLSVAIRSAVCTGGTMYFSMGSGIVYESDPGREYQETLDKGETIFTLLRTM